MRLSNTKSILVFTFGLWALGLTQCSGVDGLSKDVKVTLIPQDPIVVNANLTLFPGTDYEQKINAPWFIFSSSVENKSDKTLFLVTYIFKVTGYKDGKKVTSEYSLDPNTTCPVASTRYFLAVITSGTTYKGLNNSCDPTDYVGAPMEGWYIHGLPEADSFNYSVEVSAAGWFTNADLEPIERFVYEGFLFTQ